MNWTSQDPGSGDTGALRARSGAMNTIVLTLDHARTTFRAHYEPVTTHEWKGAAGDAFRGSCAAHLSRLSSFINALAPYSAALMIYANEVESIAEEARALKLRTEAAQEQLAAAPAYVSPNTAAATNAAKSSGRACVPDPRTAAKSALASITQERAELVRRRQAADSKVTAALGGVAIGDWAAAGSALAQAGVRRPADFDADSIRRALLDLCTLTLQGDTASLPGLLALLDTWADDPSMMRDFLEGLGGSRLVRMLMVLDQALIDGRSAIAGDVQSALRDALSSASSMWSASEAADYISALIDSPGSTLSVAYLFGDPEVAPMSSTLVQAAADAILDWERKNGTLYTLVLNVVPGVGMAPDLVYRMLGEGPRVIDPADSIFRHLARDPQSTLDWLADPTRGHDRIIHWYQERNWHDGGGYAGPMLVWEALQTVPGGLLGPDMDPGVARKLAEVNAAIIKVWADPDSRFSGVMDDEALLALAGVIAAQLPVWADSTTTLESSSTVATQSTVVHWLGMQGWTTQISRDALSFLLGQVRSSDAASGALLDATKDLQGRLVASVGSTADFTHNDALERIAGLLGMIDGAQLGNELAVAAMRDRTVERTLAITGLGAGELAGKGGIAASLVLAGAEHLALESWANHYDTALDDLWRNTGPAKDRADEARETLMGLIDGWVPPEVVHKGGQSADQYLDSIMGWYDDKVRRLDEAKTA
ncbi:hypothetical protein MHY85_13320 [Cellulomonas sp. ACRRI]|uniref:hypothetical protein n=1 Tax=Cellulomonas sp. ACRRI TaxID=2918188 RepID=UPI001EF3BB7F|nr:hypothetical protein [Cellulomonas sp. ACRRI]MCG7286950.1 hypothetical protein [Cellulomonas sp. ACRRI]